MGAVLDEIQSQLTAKPERFLVTGVAGFIGSHLLERLLSLGQEVVGIDNFITGSQRNLDAVASSVGDKYRRFTFVEGDICDAAVLAKAMQGVSIVLHQAALGSVKRSIENPIETNRVNIGGTLQVFDCARRLGVKRVVYASSSSVYGDSPASPKREVDVGRVLSPYAATKATAEIYAHVFSSLYALPCVGLRYFNVFGPRQDPNGDYAAVIPRWIHTKMQSEPCLLFGDGETSRDFCYVENVVQANLLAACANDSCGGRAYNVALGDQTTLLQLHEAIHRLVGRGSEKPQFLEFREGDVRHSKADITRAKEELGYEPTIQLAEGLRRTVESFT